MSGLNERRIQLEAENEQLLTQLAESQMDTKKHKANATAALNLLDKARSKLDSAVSVLEAILVQPFNGSWDAQAVFVQNALAKLKLKDGDLVPGTPPLIDPYPGASADREMSKALYKKNAEKVPHRPGHICGPHKCEACPECFATACTCGERRFDPNPSCPQHGEDAAKDSSA